MSVPEFGKWKWKLMLSAFYLALKMLVMTGRHFLNTIISIRNYLGSYKSIEKNIMVSNLGKSYVIVVDSICS